jgi:hypothetical protein
LSDPPADSNPVDHLDIDAVAKQDADLTELRGRE